MIRRSMSLALIFAAAAISVLPAEAADSARRFAASDSSKKRIAIIDRKGDIEWEYKIGSLHDLHVLPTGNVLFQTSMTRLLEVDPKTDKVVWEYDSASSNGNKGRPVQVHAFQRLADGVTMIAESGPARNTEDEYKDLDRKTAEGSRTESRPSARPPRYQARPENRQRQLPRLPRS